MKSVVHSADERAFVVVNPTERIWGGGFGNLGPSWAREGREKDNVKGGS